jgi:hypothetical protein
MKFLILAAIFLLPAWLGLLAARYLEAPWLVLWPLAFVMARALEIPFTVLCGRLLFEPEVRIGDVLVQSLKALPRTLWGLSLYAVLFVASLLLIVGPLFVGANYFFLPEVLILEKAGPIRAFRRSHQFLGGRSGTGVEGFLIRSGMLVAFVFLAEVMGQAILVHLFSIHTGGESLWEDGCSALALLGVFLFVPYGAAHRFLAYTNERTRQDGWDIQVAFLRLAESSPAREEHRAA